MHKISTIFYHIKRVIGISSVKQSDDFVISGLTDSFEPSKQCIDNILSFAKSHKYEKSEIVGEIEYLIN